MSKDDKSRLSRLLHLLTNLRTAKKQRAISLKDNSRQSGRSKPDFLELSDRKCDVYTISNDVICYQTFADSQLTSQVETEAAGGVNYRDDIQESRGARENGDDATHDVTSCTGSTTQQEKATSGLVVRFSDENETDEELTELTEEQRGELRQAFSMFEITGKGRIPSRDLGELLRCLGWNPSEKDLEEARQDLELSSRRTMTYSEVESYISRRGRVYYGNNAEEDMLVAFQVLDQAGTGRIPLSDFRRFLTTMGEQMSAEEAEELITGSTRNDKDYIEYQDLVKAVT